MKFTWFNLMPWPYLPDDFRAQHRSVWVDIPNTLYDPRKGHHVYHEYLDKLEYAETLGFDGIGCNEHHQNGYGLMPSPNLIAATLARRTSRAALCVIGNSIASYNPPIRVAEEFGMLDVISGGRLVAGFPVGTPMDTNFCYGQIPALTRDKYRKAHDLIMKAWASDEPFAFDGKYNQLRWVNCWPKPIQKPHPPIYIPGGGSIETWDFCLDYDYNYSYLSFFGYLRGKSLLRLLGAGGQARQGRIALPRRVRPDHLRGGQRRRGRAALRGALPLLLQPVPARLSALRGPRRLSHDGDDQIRRARPADARPPEDPREPHVEAAGRRALRDRRQSRDRAAAAR